MKWEYKVIPTAFLGGEFKGSKEEAEELEDLLNKEAADGWEYVDAQKTYGQWEGALIFRNIIFKRRIEK